MEPLQALVVDTAEAPSWSVIWLHGLGADGSDFVPVVPELGLPEAPGIRFVFPHAPELPVTCNGGYVMPAWYDIISLAENDRQVDETGLLQSRAAVRQLIAAENRRGVPASRIVLVGFSQGGAVAYLTALTHAEPLAGLIALSTYIPAPALLLAEAAAANKTLDIFAAHGAADDVVSPQLGRRARDLLRSQGYNVAWHEYPMPHSVCPQEIAAIGAWLRAKLAAGLGP